MNDTVIVAENDGTEIREMIFASYDFEVGDDENSFEVVVKRGEWESIPSKARIYVPGTEFGGLYRELKTDTKQGTISPGGMTWRGMLQKKIISPASGADYAYATGELNAVIKSYIEPAFPFLFYGSTETTNVTVSGYRFNRYCTMYDGLQAMCKSKGYRLRILYDQKRKGVVVDAVLIRNYSDSIEWSEDYELDYIMQTKSDGVNHLICLGNGELKNRDVQHLYVDGNGNISTRQTFRGVDEVAEVYDYAGAETADLIQSGQNRLKERIKENNKFTINIEASGRDIDIRDLVGGKDYLSGMNMSAPVTGKVLRWQNGFSKIEYKLSDDVTIS